MMWLTVGLLLLKSDSWRVNQPRPTITMSISSTWQKKKAQLPLNFHILIFNAEYHNVSALLTFVELFHAEECENKENFDLCYSIHSLLRFSLSICITKSLMVFFP